MTRPKQTLCGPAMAAAQMFVEKFQELFHEHLGRGPLPCSGPSGGGPPCQSQFHQICERVIDQIESMPAIVRVIDQIESMPAIVTLSVLSGLQRVRPVVRFGKRGSL